MNLRASWTKAASAAVVACGLGMTSLANAAVILTFGQNSNSSTITATNNTDNTATMINGNDVAVTVTQYGSAGAPFNAFLNLSLNSTSAATPFMGQILQSYVGTASFTSLASGAGINYLTATFTDFVFGTAGGSSLTLSASEPPGTVSLTSDILSTDILGTPRALGFGFADVTGPATIVGSTLQGFTSSISGTVSAAAVPVPEPASLALLGAGLVSLGAFKRRRRAKA